MYCDCWYFTLSVPFPIRVRTSHLLFLTSGTSLKNNSEKQIWKAQKSVLHQQFLHLPNPKLAPCPYSKCWYFPAWPLYRAVICWAPKLLQPGSHLTKLQKIWMMSILLWTAVELTWWRVGSCGSSSQFCFGSKSMAATLIRKSEDKVLKDPNYFITSFSYSFCFCINFGDKLMNICITLK